MKFKIKTEGGTEIEMEEGQKVEVEINQKIYTIEIR